MVEPQTFNLLVARSSRAGPTKGKRAMLETINLIELGAVKKEGASSIEFADWHINTKKALVIVVVGREAGRKTSIPDNKDLSEFEAVTLMLKANSGVMEEGRYLFHQHLDPYGIDLRNEVARYQLADTSSLRFELIGKETLYEILRKLGYEIAEFFCNRCCAPMRSNKKFCSWACENDI